MAYRYPGTEMQSVNKKSNQLVVKEKENNRARGESYGYIRDTRHTTKNKKGLKKPTTRSIGSLREHSILPVTRDGHISGSRGQPARQAASNLLTLPPLFYGILNFPYQLQ